MPARAAELHLPAPGTGHHRAMAKREMAKRQAGHIVHAIDRIAGETVKQPVIQHGLRAATAFFGGLENEMYGAGKIALLCQQLCRAQKHGGMTIMPAGMHLSDILGGIEQPSRFRQR